MQRPSTLFLLSITVVSGLLLGAFLVRETVKPLDASRLHPLLKKSPAAAAAKAAAAAVARVKVPKQPKGADKAKLQQHSVARVNHHVSDEDEVFVASRRAVENMEKEYTLENVLNRLGRPYPKSYDFKPEVYSANVNGPSLDDSTRDAWTSASEEGGAETEDGEEDEGPEAHLWSAEPPKEEEKKSELAEILFGNLPWLVLWVGLFLWVEVSAVMWRRGRDILIETGEWRKDDHAFKTQCGQESQWMIWRPYVVTLSGIGIFLAIKDSIDVFGKCFWNWYCWANLDCNLRILTPAVADCTEDVLLPALIVTAIVMSFLYAIVWSCTRPWAAVIMGTICMTGLIAASTVSLFVCFMWLVAAFGFSYFYFWVLPYLPDKPEWCQDLGNLCFATDPNTGAIRDGDHLGNWEGSSTSTPDPTEEQLSVLTWVERFNWAIADFVQRHMRWYRIFWNGLGVHVVIYLLIVRRVRIHGLENISHLGNMDKILMVSNHRTFFDFFAISIMMWHHCGMSKFSFYPVRSTFFYTNFLGALVNFIGSGIAMIPPILNTPSDKEKQTQRDNAKKWNEYALRRIISDLNRPGTVVGIHPEGTRCHAEDPYEMKPTKPGAGQVALECKDAHVIPMFLKGLDGDFSRLVARAFDPSINADTHPIDIYFGPNINFSDLRDQAEKNGDFEGMRAAAGERITEHIRGIGQKLKAKLESQEKEENKAYQSPTV